MGKTKGPAESQRKGQKLPMPGAQQPEAAVLCPSEPGELTWNAADAQHIPHHQANLHRYHHQFPGWELVPFWQIPFTCSSQLPELLWGTTEKLTLGQNLPVTEDGDSPPSLSPPHYQDLLGSPVLVQCCRGPSLVPGMPVLSPIPLVFRPVNQLAAPQRNSLHQGVAARRWHAPQKDRQKNVKHLASAKQ